MFDQLLTQIGLKQEDLSIQEMETLKQWASGLETRQLNLHDVREYVSSMINSLERQLFQEPDTLVGLLFRRKRKVHMMARLNNYLLLRDLIDAPQKARAEIEKQISRFKKPAT